MELSKDIVAAKLRRWEKYLIGYRLPKWEEIPNLGLYMEQVVALMSNYFDYLPPELREEQFITAAAINNYVRRRLMPEPVKKRYYRVHLAYLIVICSLRQSLSISTMNTLLPVETPEEEVREMYDRYIHLHHRTSEYFVREVKLWAADILDHEVDSELNVTNAEELVFASAVMSGFAKLLAEKLLLLNRHLLEDAAAQDAEK